MFFPTILSKNWFITVYVIIYILSPYLNKFIKSISQKEYKKFLIIILILWCIIPTVFGVFNNSSENTLFYSRFIWLMIIYFVGAYIHLYGFDVLKSNIKKFVCAFISFMLMILSIFLIYRFRVRFEHIGLNELAYFWTPNNILMFLLSISVFGLFLSLKINNNKVINLIASTTLGVYLIHDGELSYYLWQTFFNVKEHLLGNRPITYIFIVTIIVFCVCLLIDLIRKLVEKYTFSKFIDFVNGKLKK